MPVYICDYCDFRCFATDDVTSYQALSWKQSFISGVLSPVWIVFQKMGNSKEALFSGVTRMLLSQVIMF